MVFRGIFPARELTPAPGGLLSVAQVVRHAARDNDERWIRGYAAETNANPTRIRILDATGAEAAVIYDGSDIVEFSDITPFFIEVSSKNTALSLLNSTPLDSVMSQLEAVTQKAVEFELWDGVAARENADNTTPYLTKTGAATVVTSGGLHPVRALARLEQALFDSPTGAAGVIHMTRDVATMIGTQALVYDRSGDDVRIRTVLGTEVVAGTGYSGAGPIGDAGAAPSDTNKWMYLTGPVDVHLGASELLNDDLSQGFHAAKNDSEIRANRPAAVHFEQSEFFAAQVTIPATP